MQINKVVAYMYNDLHKTFRVKRKGRCRDAEFIIPGYLPQDSDENEKKKKQCAAGSMAQCLFYDV